jgi:hypothetical protein
MSSPTPDEHEQNSDEENILPQSSQVWTSLVTPILTERVYMGGIAENEMVNQIDIAIRRLLIQPNHQPPYRYCFHWTIDEEPNLNYSVVLSIREPSRRP